MQQQEFRHAVATLRAARFKQQGASSPPAQDRGACNEVARA
jgi:hypothetical protein